MVSRQHLLSAADLLRLLICSFCFCFYRFYAIMHPFKTRWTKSRWVLILVMIWMLAFAMSSILFVYGQAKPFLWDKKEYYECIENFPNDDSEEYDIFMFVFTFALPLVILGLTYTSIAWKMWKHSSPGNADIVRDQHQFQAKLKVSRVLHSAWPFLFYRRTSAFLMDLTLDNRI